jgi:hypothetical protein
MILLCTVNEVFEQSLESNHLVENKPDSKSSDSDSSGSESSDSASLGSQSDDSSGFRDWDSQALLSSISESIDWLCKLSNLVRKASYFNQTKRANKHQLKDELDGDVTELLDNFFATLIKREYKELGDDLVKRLSASMVLRRRQIAYRQSRQKRWRLQQTEYISRKQEMTQTRESARDSGLGPSRMVNLSEEFSEPEKFVKSVSKKSTIPTIVTATTLDPVRYRKLAAPSQISRGTTASLATKSRTLVPPPPRDASVAEEFVCDYCCLVLPKTLAQNRRLWT